MSQAPGIKKQAVIVVHGMGEQRPMETLRSFVTAVWETDADGNIPQVMDEARRTWIVPDRRNGILDLSRITTRANEDGVRTDFFELYWADVFTGNTLQQLYGWLRGLLFRWPLQVPKDVFWAWLLLWFLSIGAAAAIFYVMTHDPLSIFKKLELAFNDEPTFLQALAAAVLSLALFFFMEGRLRNVLKHNPGAFHLTFSKLLPPAALLIVFLGVLLFAPWNLLGDGKFLLLGLAALIAWLIKAVIVPYLGDVARYTQNAPWAIEARAQIRARGLGLLRQLHGRGADGQPQGAGEYQRVIVVGHSLGSVVAYDLLRYYWAEAGPVGKNSASPETIQALIKVDDYVTSCSDQKDSAAGKESFAFGEYVNKQSRVANAMSATHDGWKITDFVTLGCPLTHAEFLIANDKPQFDKMVRELVLPASVPVQDVTRGSFLYDPHYGANGGDPLQKRADHGAVFACTRWTNIFDPARGIVFGDFISGPLAENFGKGVKDIAVFIRMKRRILGWLGSGFFTHTDYWNAKASGQKAAENDRSARPSEPPDENRRDHVTELKLALNLGVPGPLPPKSPRAPSASHPAPAGKSRPKSRRADTTSQPS